MADRTIEHASDAVMPTEHTPDVRADGEQTAVHACPVCAVEHPPHDSTCRCPNCICEECRPNECPCAGAGEKARKDHDRSIFSDRLQSVLGDSLHLPTGRPHGTPS